MSTPLRFSPRRPATRARRSVALLLVGPLLWLVALAATAFVAQEGDAIAIALSITGVSFVAALALLAALRRQRIREEAEGAPAR